VVVLASPGAKAAIETTGDRHALHMIGMQPYRQLAVTLVETPVQLKAALDQLLTCQPRLVGLDIETLGPAIEDPVSLIQLAVGEPGRGIGLQQVVIDCLAVDPDGLAVLLEAPQMAKLVHSAEFERDRLLYHFGLRLRPVLDTRREMETIQRTLAALEPEARAAIVPWQPRENAKPARAFFDNKLGTLSELLLGFELDKQEQSSDWSRRPLQREQLLYAAADAAVLLPLISVERRLGRRLGIEPQLLKMHRSFDENALPVSERRLRIAPPTDDRLAAELSLFTASDRAQLALRWRACRSARLPAAERVRLRLFARERWLALSA
jgi:hypothetical protein